MTRADIAAYSRVDYVLIVGQTVFGVLLIVLFVRGDRPLAVIFLIVTAILAVVVAARTIMRLRRPPHG